MKNILVLAVFFFAFISSSFACLNAKQLKLFPIGIHNNKVISIDVEVSRTSLIEAYRRISIYPKPTGTNGDDITWILKTRLSVYDLNQNLISSQVIDSTYSVGEYYSEKLSNSHQKVLKLILKEYPAIELFEVKSLSFCDFKKECDYLTMQYDSIAETTSLSYQNQKNDLAIFKDTENYYLNDKHLQYSVSGYTISSIRIYETKKIKLVITHLGTEENFLAMAELTDAEFKREGKKQETDYSSIKTFVYQEPVNHHGEGIDVFFSILK